MSNSFTISGAHTPPNFSLKLEDLNIPATPLTRSFKSNIKFTDLPYTSVNYQDPYISGIIKTSKVQLSTSQIHPDLKDSFTYPNIFLYTTDEQTALSASAPEHTKGKLYSNLKLTGTFAAIDQGTNVEGSSQVAYLDNM